MGEVPRRLGRLSHCQVLLSAVFNTERKIKDIGLSERFRLRFNMLAGTFMHIVPDVDIEWSAYRGG